MKKNKLFAGLLVVAVLVFALALVSGVLAAGSNSSAKILDVQIVEQTIIVQAEVPCPNTAEAKTKVDATSIKVMVYSVPNPLAGVCAPGTPPVVQTVTVNITLSKAKDVFVLHGKMYP